MPSTNLVVRLDAWLPQTQCTRCGYPGCRAYAEALAAGDTDINRCPPGGDVSAARAGKTPRRRTQAARSRLRRTGTAHACGDRRNALYRLSQVPRCMPGGRHRGRAPAHAHGDRFRVQRLRTVRATLPGGLHRLGTVFGARGSRAVAGLCAGRNHALARAHRAAACAPGAPDENAHDATRLDFP